MIGPGPSGRRGLVGCEVQLCKSLLLKAKLMRADSSGCARCPHAAGAEQFL